MLKDNPKRYNYNILSNSVFNALGMGDTVVNTLSNGFIGDLKEESVNKLRNDEKVAYVERDMKVQIKDVIVRGEFVLGAGASSTQHDSWDDELSDRLSIDRGDEEERRNKKRKSDKSDSSYAKTNNTREALIGTNRTLKNRDHRFSQAQNAQKYKNNKLGDLRKNNVIENADKGGGSTPRIRTQSHAHAVLEYQNDAPWGISRISSGTKVNIMHTFRYPYSSGKNTQVYVIDTGVELSHPELQGRAFFGANFTTSSSDADLNGHGTHVSGVIAGKTVGIARKAEIVAVKVLDKMGSGMLSSVIMGIDYVIRKHSEKMERYEETKRNEYYKRVLDGRYDSGQDMNDNSWSGWREKGIPYKRTGGSIRSTSAFDPLWHVSSIINTVRSFLSAVNHDLATENDPLGQLKLTGLTDPFRISNFNPLLLITGNSSYATNPLGAASSNHKPKSIVNMSVGGLKSKVLDYAVKYATDIGIHFSAAAGNDHEDACEFSPSSSKLAMTAGASTASDTVAFFSNYGQCVDLYAPGVDIKSSWINGEYKVVSGTSMAAPHVTGAMALYLGEKDYTPAELINMLKNDAYKVVHEPGKNTDENYSLISIRKLIREIYDNSKEMDK